MSLTIFMILFISSVITSVKPSVKICCMTPGRQFLITIWIVAKNIHYNKKKTYVLKNDEQ